MFWADKIAKTIIDSGNFKPYWVDDMKTPSGYPHIGSLRGPLIHDVIAKALKNAGAEVKFTYVFNDFDPMDELPPMYPQLKDEVGKPLRSAKSPLPEFESLGEMFTTDLKQTLESLGIHPEYLSSWDMYREGKFDGVIREALDHAELIQDIYQEVSGSKKRQAGWLPFQVICEKCGKVGTTKVFAWDGKLVSYRCEVNLVKWATGCGYEGKISPFGGTGKLPWKVDWAAHWKVIGITVEGAGKDHASAGGSYDIAMEIVEKVFKYPQPFKMPYEFLLIGGRKMSSSKGIGLKAHDLVKILPVEVGRFLFTRNKITEQVEFDPDGTMEIPDLFDEYDRCYQAFIDGSDENLARAFELAQVKSIPKKEKTFLPRFKDVANYLQQPSINLTAKFTALKGSALNVFESQLLAERIVYAKIWIRNYAPAEFQFAISEKIPTEVAKLTDSQRNYLGVLAGVLDQKWEAEAFQQKLFDVAKEVGISGKDAFAAIYTALIGKTHGPKAAWFILSHDPKIIAGRFNEVSQTVMKEASSTLSFISKPDYFVIDTKLKEAIPSISVGMALIKGVSIQKLNVQLEVEKQDVLDSLATLTTEELGTYPEIVSYRKLYKQMGVDWHSRRPSPEALLRRIALKKGLYNVNTCVDAYNLVVMKHRVSVGAFDADQVKFPTVLRFAGEGDEILLLGDETPTKYTAKEIAYYDKQGGYNLDFNYRDAQRTKVTEQTKNIWINVDGVFEITPEQVQQSLNETIAIIQKYCGGSVEFSGVVK